LDGLWLVALLLIDGGELQLRGRKRRQNFQRSTKRRRGFVDLALSGVNNAQCVIEDGGALEPLDSLHQLCLRLGQITALDKRQHGKEVLLFVRGRRLGTSAERPDQSESE
jgi:hypothetical protein